MIGDFSNVDKHMVVEATVLGDTTVHIESELTNIALLKNILQMLSRYSADTLHGTLHITSRIDIRALLEKHGLKCQ